LWSRKGEDFSEPREVKNRRRGGGRVEIMKALLEYDKVASFRKLPVDAESKLKRRSMAWMPGRNLNSSRDL